MRGSTYTRLVIGALLLAGWLMVSRSARSEGATATVPATTIATAQSTATATVQSTAALSPTLRATSDARATAAATDPLANRLWYWDLGLTLLYPTDWTVVQYAAGQVLLARSLPYQQTGTQAQTPTASLNQVVIGLRIVDPVRDLGLAKDASLEEIAFMVNYTSSSLKMSISGHGSALVAGLNAGYVLFTEDSMGLYGDSIAFRMPDGRVGAIIGLGPQQMWAEFAPTFDTIRASMQLLRPKNFAVPSPLTGTQVRFLQGGLRFTLPTDWQDLDLGSNTHVYLPPNGAQYLDNSGFSNGPQLSIAAYPMSGSSAKDALVQVIGGNIASRIQDIKLGTQAGVSYTETDRTSGQSITFIGVISSDGKIFNVLRWTTPGMLSEMTRPYLDLVLSAMQFEPPVATLVARKASATPTRTMIPATVTPKAP